MKIRLSVIGLLSSAMLFGRWLFTHFCAGAFCIANSAADPSDPGGGTVYVVWSDNRNGSATATNTDVFLARSIDGGQTWSRVEVDTSTNDQFYPWVSVGQDGRVDVGYMDRFPSAGQTECKFGFTLTRIRFATNGTVASKTTQRVILILRTLDGRDALIGLR